MLTVEQIKQLADGHGLVDSFGYCYHKEADGIRCHETDLLIKWPYLVDGGKRYGRKEFIFRYGRSAG